MNYTNDYMSVVDEASASSVGRSALRTDGSTMLWHKLALALILLVSAFLNLFRLDQNGYGNAYYAAAVKSMLMNWHNFFFLSFDPGGFVSIDKPPLGFWLQAASARLFGFNGWSLLLPQALAGIASVALLYVLVRRVFGPTMGLLAALVLAITPVSVAAARNNTPDTLLVLITLLAALVVSIAAETGRLRWLLLGALLVGLGFNLKMFEAYLVLPALILVYLLAAPLPLRTRLWHLALAALVLLVISFSWILAVDLTPVTQRPYVGSSATNSELNLALGYNGLNRITGMKLSNSGASSTGGFSQLVTLIGIGETGLPSPIRLLNKQLGGQIGWLLLMAICGLLVVLRRWRMRGAFTREQQGLMLWGTWFVTMFVFFSVALFPHGYYMVMLAPAISALAGIGVVKLWEAYQQPGWRGWLLPVALVLSAGAQWLILASFPDWNNWLSKLVIALCLIVALALVVARLAPRLFRAQKSLPLAPITTAGMIILLIGPMLWSLTTTQHRLDPISVVAGPSQASPFAGLVSSIIPEDEHLNPALERYLLIHQGQARYLVATLNAPTAAPFILDTGKQVMAIGGYIGSDPILSASQFQALVNTGSLRYVVLNSLKVNINQLPPQIAQMLAKAFKGQQGKQNSNSFPFQNDVLHWITSHCKPVPAAQVQSNASDRYTINMAANNKVPVVLFDCVPQR